MNQEHVQTAPKRRRILYVENGIGYGGAVICLRHLVRNLDRSRFEPMVITGRGGPQYEEIAEESLWRHIPDRRTDIVGKKQRLKDTGWIHRVPGLNFLLTQLLARSDDVVNFLPHFLQIFQAARKFHPNLIHVNNEPLCNRAAIFTGKLLRIPVVCHVRGTPDGSRMMRWLYGLPDHFIPVSHWISQGMAELGVPAEKRTVVYDGINLADMKIDADGSRFRTQSGIPRDAFAVGLVGLLIPWKGQEIFLDAASTLKHEIPNLRMLIVGGTPEECIDFERVLKARVEREGLNDVVSLTGHVSDMPVVYNGLDVAVSASIAPEPLGTMVIETMAMARPLIAPNHGGGAEMADHDQTALLFEPGDATSLAKAILRLYREEGLGERLGEAARQKALKTFAVDEHVRLVQEVYYEVLANAIY
ncbi:glycosyltransferase family 4 protein [Gammaproteobacteria bacterium]|nr:glycosyltransferase family 4 protein [Gammaproteobacteria bacterium]